APKQNKKNLALTKELLNRKSETTGGVNKRRIMTGYREEAVKIACALLKNGEMRATDLINTFGCDKKTNSILYNNHYGWFIKIQRGVYNISDKCIEDLNSDFYKNLVNHFIGGKKNEI
ncbi:MAG: DUF2161 domain-containing phosphodiesterase, partial [Clostridiales bacterium]|nr:DUF2161 domain-containing phosphodiesterase [Clostridiales bacterium]